MQNKFPRTIDQNIKLTIQPGQSLLNLLPTA